MRTCKILSPIVLKSVFIIELSSAPRQTPAAPKPLMICFVPEMLTVAMPACAFHETVWSNAAVMNRASNNRFRVFITPSVKIFFILPDSDLMIVSCSMGHETEETRRELLYSHAQ